MGKKQTQLVTTLVQRMKDGQKQHAKVCDEWSRYSHALINETDTSGIMKAIETEHGQFGSSIKLFESSITALEQHATKMSKKWVGKKSLSDHSKSALTSAKTQCTLFKKSLVDTDPNRKF